MALALITPMIFAETYGNEAAVAVEGSATLLWGYDLNEEAHGFNNKADWKITIPLISKQTFGTKSEGDNYAEINIKDVEYGIQGKKKNTDADWKKFNDGGDRKIGGMNAKLVFGEVYVTVFDKPSFETNYAQIFEPIKTDDYEDEQYKYAAGFEGFGTKIGYDTDDFDFGIKVASEDPMDRGVETTNKYAFGADATIRAIDNVTVKASVNYANWKNAAGKDGVFGFGAEAEVTAIEDLTITLGFDSDNNAIDDKGKEAFGWDASLAAEYKFVSAGLYVASPGTPFEGHNKEGEAIMDMGAFVKVTDGDMVDNLSAWAALATYHLLTEKEKFPLPMAFGAGADYKIEMNDVNYLKPFAAIYGNNYFNPVDHKEAAKFATAYELGAEYGLFTNTTVTAKFESGKTVDDKHLFDQAPVNVDSKDDKGYFSLAVKVKY